MNTRLLNLIKCITCSFFILNSLANICHMDFVCCISQMLNLDTGSVGLEGSWQNLILMASPQT